MFKITRVKEIHSEPEDKLEDVQVTADICQKERRISLWGWLNDNDKLVGELSVDREGRKRCSLAVREGSRIYCRAQGGSENSNNMCKDPDIYAERS